MAVAASVLLASCSDDAEEQRIRDATAGDLPKMVLQQEDVPGQFRRLDGVPARLSGREVGFQAHLAEFVHPSEDPEVQSYLSEFGVSAEEAERGDTICITSFAVLLEDASDWELALFNSAEFTLELFHDVEKFEVESVEVPNLGEATIGFRLRSPSEDLCAVYDDYPAEAHVIFFTNRNVYAALIVWASERGADLEEAVTLAEKQASRIEAVFEGDEQ